MSRLLKTFSLCLALVCVATAQQSAPPPAQQSAPPPQAEPRTERGAGPGGGMGGMMMMGGGNAGQITAIAGDNVTIKTQTGAVVTLHTSADTRVFKDRAPASLKDLKVGDYIAGGGPSAQEGAPLEARFIAVLDETAIQRIRDFQANLGKTVIVGEIKAIDDTKLTIARPDGVTQQIELDETSSLKRGRDESITLADVKVGDRVFGQGELKSGTFVPHELRVMTPGMRRGARGDGVLMNAPPPGNEPAPTPAAPPPPK